MQIYATNNNMIDKLNFKSSVTHLGKMKRRLESGIQALNAN